MSEKTKEIRTKAELNGLLRESIVELVRDEPQMFVDAMASNKEALRASLEKAGFIVGGEAATESIAAAVRNAHREAQSEGRIIGGFGARFRSAASSVRIVDEVTGRERRTYLHGDRAVLAEAWFRAYFEKDSIDPVTRKHVRELRAEMEKLRAPTYALTGEAGTSGSFLVPTIIAAEIFEVMNERFVLRGMVEVFTTASPLEIPRRIRQLQVYRGAPATDLTENDPNILGQTKLSPERVGALAYIDPKVAMAAAVGPVRYITEQFAEALALDAQRTIIAGNQALREPKGINTLPTSGGELYDRMQTAAWTNTDRATRRASIRSLYYKIPQRHRESGKFVWICNNDVVQVMASLNDTDQQPWKDAAGGAAATYLGKQVVESSALVTAGTADLLGGDMGQYAWAESPEGISMETTTVGGKAWESNTIGVKVVQHVDGAPILPPVFGRVPSVVV